jgi:hypothetical protein
MNKKCIGVPDYASAKHPKPIIPCDNTVVEDEDWCEQHLAEMDGRISKIFGRPNVIQPTKTLAEPHREMMEMLIREFSKAPDSQIGEHCRGQFKDVFDNIHLKTNAELYDFLVSIAETSCCQTSSFVKTACNMRQLYKRPA